LLKHQRAAIFSALPSFRDSPFKIAKHELTAHPFDTTLFNSKIDNFARDLTEKRHGWQRCQRFTCHSHCMKTYIAKGHNERLPCSFSLLIFQGCHLPFTTNKELILTKTSLFCCAHIGSKSQLDNCKSKQTCSTRQPCGQSTF
jgi:hypothetical protein